MGGQNIYNTKTNHCKYLFLRIKTIWKKNQSIQWFDKTKQSQYQKLLLWNGLIIHSLKEEKMTKVKTIYNFYNKQEKYVSCTDS